MQIAKTQRVPKEQLVGPPTQSQKSRVVLCPNVEGGRLIRVHGLCRSHGALRRHAGASRRVGQRFCVGSPNTA